MEQVNMTAKADRPAPSGWAIAAVRIAGVVVAMLGWYAFATGAAVFAVLGGLAMGAGAALALWGHAAFEAGLDRLFFSKSPDPLEPSAQ